MLTAAFILALVKDLLIACGAGVAIYVGLKGLSTWQRQHLGSMEHDVAKRILRASLKMRDAIRQVRNPAIWSGEIQAGVEKYGPKDRPPTDMEQTRAAYALRFEKVDQARLDLDLETLEGEILWGEKIRTMTDKLRLSAMQLGIAVRQHLYESDTPRQLITDPVWLDKLAKERERIDKIMYAGGSPEDDTLTAQITETLNEIDAYCRPKLKYK
jgi:hypothetical protein